MGQDLDLDTHACKPCQKPRHGTIAKMRSGDANAISGGLAKCCQNYIAPAAGKEPDAEFGRVVSGVQIRAEPFENAVGSVVHGIEMGAHKSDRRHGSDLDQKIMAAILIADVAEEFRRINSTAGRIVGAQIDDRYRMTEEVQLLVQMVGQNVSDRAQAAPESRGSAEQPQHLRIYLGA